jgi:hypothetical protein
MTEPTKASDVTELLASVRAVLVDARDASLLLRGFAVSANDTVRREANDSIAKCRTALTAIDRLAEHVRQQAAAIDAFLATITRQDEWIVAELEARNKLIEALREKFASVELDPDIRAVLYDNLWDIYVR